MNDYAHLRLHEATIHEVTRRAGRRRAATRHLLATLTARRDTRDRATSAAARRPSQVRPA